MASFLARTAGLGINPPVANAKTVQGYAPDGLVRVARAGAPSGTAINLTTNFVGTPPGTAEPASSYQPILTLAITAPTAGFIQVTETVGAQRVSGAGNVAVFARLRLLDDTTGANASPRQNAYVALDGTPIASMTMTWVFPVAAGTQSVVLDAARYAVGTGAVNAFSPMMTATFVPFGSGGGATLSAGEAAPGVPGGPDTGSR